MFAAILFALLIAHILAQTLANNHNQIYMVGIDKDAMQELVDKNLRVLMDHVDEQMGDHFRLDGDGLQGEILLD
jgi:hypothetical protein